MSRPTPTSRRWLQGWLTQQARAANPNAADRNIRIYWHNRPHVTRYASELVELNLRRGGGIVRDIIRRNRR